MNRVGTTGCTVEVQHLNGNRSKGSIPREYYKLKEDYIDGKGVDGSLDWWFSYEEE